MNGTPSDNDRIAAIEGRANFIGDAVILIIASAIGGGLGYATQANLGGGDWSIPSVVVASISTVVAARLLRKRFAAIR